MYGSPADAPPTALRGPATTPAKDERPVTHPRGWFFEDFPRLLDVERGRRPDAERLSRLLSDHGFIDVGSCQLWETRRRYPDREIYLAEIRARTGRSILHELTDAELEHLVATLRQHLPLGPI